MECSLSNDDVDCAIFQCPTADVTVEDLPSIWTLKGSTYHTLTLPCGHHFNPSALALHFLLADMRCPVCRQGIDSKMTVDDLPRPLRPLFRKKLRLVDTRTEEDDDLVTLLENITVDFSELEQHLCLVVDISVNMYSRVLLQSPIRPVGHSGNFWTPFHIQQSFSRILNQQVHQFSREQQATVTFSLQHPMMYLPIQTRNIDIHSFLNPADRKCALPLRVQDGEHEQVVATMISALDDVLHLTLYVNREVMNELFMQCINSHLEQLGQQADT